MLEFIVMNRGLELKISNKILTPVQIRGNEYYSYICAMLKTNNNSWWWFLLRQMS
jgi:hypothetical protein